jgi:putative hemolysin
LSAVWPFLVLVVSSIVTALVATLSAALGTVPRAAVEEVAARRGDSSARAKRAAERLSRVLDEADAHGRALGLVHQACAVVVVVASVWWVLALRTGGVLAAGLQAVATSPTVDASAGVSAGDGAGAAASVSVGMWGQLGWLDVGVGGVVAVVVLWVMGVAIPAAAARYAGARVIYSRSGLVRGVHASLSPVRSLGAFIDELVRRLAGAERRDAEEQVQAELLSVIEEGEASGALQERERAMLEAVVRFRDLTVAQIMTPRPDIEAMEVTSDLGTVTRTIRKLGHSRIPVYEENLDHIVGIFYVKDLMHWLGGDGMRGGQKFDLRALLRPGVFVPETKTVKELLEELIQKKVHIALVADEYGGTAGLVTIEDIVEEIFGDIRDEYEPTTGETPDVVLRAEQRKAELDAAARIMDVNGLIETLGVQIPESEDYDTVGGFVVTSLGRIPVKGETFIHETMHFTILEAKPTRVVKVALEVRSGEAAPVGAPGVDGAAAGGAGDASDGGRAG